MTTHPVHPQTRATSGDEAVPGPGGNRPGQQARGRDRTDFGAMGNRRNRGRYGAADRVGLLRLARVLGLGRAYFPFAPRGSTV